MSQQALEIFDDRVKHHGCFRRSIYSLKRYGFFLVLISTISVSPTNFPKYKILHQNQGYFLSIAFRQNFPPQIFQILFENSRQNIDGFFRIELEGT